MNDWSRTALETDLQEPAPSKVLLDIQELCVTYGSGARATRALDRASLTIRAGEFVSVVGPSGCGKSTLMHVIAGFMQPDSGTILLNGKPVRAPGSDRTVMLQQPTLFPWLNVFENVELGPKSRGVPREERQKTVRHYLDLVGLSEAHHRKPYELSGGMQQRAALARALANDAEMLLVDEPFGALDALTRERMQREIVRIWYETGKTILFITHDVEEAVFCSTSIVVMEAHPGRIVDKVAVPFSRLYAQRRMNSRAIKSSPDYIAVREQVLAKVMKDEGEETW